MVNENMDDTSDIVRISKTLAARSYGHKADAEKVAQLAKIFRYSRSHGPILLLGHSGSGKSTMLNALNALHLEGVTGLDLDWIGFRGPAYPSGISPWLVRPGIVQLMLNTTPAYKWMASSCDNAYKDVSLSFVDETHIERRTTYPSLTSMPWGAVVFLTWKPSDAELSFRFGIDRAMTHTVSRAKIDSVLKIIEERPYPVADIPYVDVTGIRDPYDAWIAVGKSLFKWEGYHG